MQQLSLFGDAVDLSVRPIPRPYNKQLQELYDFAKEQARKWWNREFDITIVLTNAKWRRWEGVYISYPNNSRPPYIKMSMQVNVHLSQEEIFGILLHEMVHWHLQTTGQPFGDADEAFVKECARVGAPFSGALSAQKAYRKFKEGV